MGSPTEALGHCDKALRLDQAGSAWKVRLRKGEAFLLLGRHDEALALFQVRARADTVLPDRLYN
jgi:hypothetical protein